jgi:diguanylate cyclase (GGDEF)-like protein/PAS domain S-box-containing protein
METTYGLLDISVLYVEDELEAREMLSRMLAMNYPGMKLYLADNGAAGLELFKQIKPQIVMTDINMPVMNGIAMAREIKAIDPDAVIVAVTAHSDTSYLLSAIEIGIHHYVLKPVNYAELFGVIDRIVEKTMLKRLVGEQLEKIRRREQQLSEAQKITHLGSWEWDLTSRRTVWSDEMYRILGLEPESVAASYRSFLQRVHPADRKALAKLVRQLFANAPGPNSHYFRVQRPDGTARIVRGQLDLSSDETGKPVSLIGTLHDVTEQKWAEAALRASEQRFARIFQATPDLLSITSFEDGSFLEVNEAFLRALGYQRAEVLGQPAAQLEVWADERERAEMLRMLAEQGEVRDLEVRYRSKAGEELWGLVSAESMEMNGKQYILTLFKDISERKRMEDTIKHQAQHDALTDLPNRKLFMDFLALELAQARRNRRFLAVLFLDLDRFKQINDTLGHAAGDLLLQAVAQRLKRCVRESDTVARIGGDEFNVLMPDMAQSDDVGTVVRKIMGVFQHPFLLDNVEIDATTSVGISMFPEDGDSCEELVQKADSAMYVAKQTSGNSYQFYNEEINRRTVQRQKMERLLREAVAKGELELLFQPQVGIDKRQIVAAEALLRWRHPEEGLLLPWQFLGIAEETGAIIPIGEWVLRSACSQMKQWQDKGYRFPVTVNLSNRQFAQNNLCDMTARALAETGLNPQALELEVTEKAIMDNLDFSTRSMRMMTELGVGFSVDDFGIGASSLQTIKRLPIGKLKIDRSFIKNIVTQRDDKAVVSAVICMSHNLKMRVNAVGVESEDQLTLIRDYGCDEVQGDLISKPLTAPQFEIFESKLRQSA